MPYFLLRQLSAWLVCTDSRAGNNKHSSAQTVATLKLRRERRPLSFNVIRIVGPQWRRRDGRIRRSTESITHRNGKRRYDLALSVDQHMREQASSDELRIGHRLACTLDHGAAAILLAKAIFPMHGILAADDRCDARRCGGGVLVVGVLWLDSDDAAEILPELMLDRRGSHDLAVARRIKPIPGGPARHEAAAVARPLTGCDPFAQCPIHEGEEIVGHSDIEIAALARLSALGQGQQNVHHCGVSATRNIGDQCGWNHRLISIPHRQRKKTGITDVIQVVPRDITLRPGLSVAGNRTIDDTRIDLGDAFIIEAESLHNTRPELLDND